MISSALPTTLSSVCGSCGCCRSIRVTEENAVRDASMHDARARRVPPSRTCAIAPSGVRVHPVIVRSVGLREREGERELGARALLARDRDASAVRIDDALRDREPESGATGLLPAVPVAIEHVRKLGVGDSRTLVAHCDDRILAVAVEGDLD